ncbi:MAG: NAD(P)/FAD-dependent oxidoreductase [Bacteroidota bacterium]
MKGQVAIIGAGLSGLLLGKRLQEAGISFKIFEARNRLGGRILTLTDAQKRVEMGATWFGSQHIHLRALLDELSIESFSQFQDGKGIFEASSMSPIQAFELPEEEQSSFRIVGGTNTLINRLASHLGTTTVKTNAAVTAVHQTDDGLLLHFEHLSPEPFDRVVSTLPPNLFLHKLEFDPPLSPEMRSLATQTHTWMGTSIKFGVTYERPFWRERGFAGICFSNSSIASEIHDHSDELGEKFSLKGFLVPGAVKLTAAQREEMVRDQLKRFFGEAGGDYLQYDELLWANESYTMGGLSNDLVPHLNNGNPAFATAEMDNKLLLSGSETSPVYGGYMEGAVYAAQLATEWVRSQVSPHPSQHPDGRLTS